MLFHSRKLICHVLCFLLAFAAGRATTDYKRQLVTNRTFSELPRDLATRLIASQEKVPQAKTDGSEPPANFLVNDDQSGYYGYSIQKLQRKARVDYSDEMGVSDKWVDVSYVTVKRTGKLLRKFDADVYFGLGNSADFGFFPFLGGKSQQLFISQDIPRRGCQWIVSLSPRFRVIFDGQALAVGREASDLGAIDLDKDGVNEVTAPITDFYGFHDKMSMSQIPLPNIIFKYQPAKERYLPANSIFRDYVFQGVTGVPEVSNNIASEFTHRSAVLSNLLTYVYAGKERYGWDFYNRNYKLGDKEEVRRRVKAILRDQPVYNLVYNNGKNK